MTVGLRSLSPFVELSVFSSFSSRRSHLSATRTILAAGQFSAISAFHLVSTFSRESLLSTYLSRQSSPGKVELARVSHAKAEHYGLGIVV